MVMGNKIVRINILEFLKYHYGKEFPTPVELSEIEDSLGITKEDASANLRYMIEKNWVEPHEGLSETSYEIKTEGMDALDVYNDLDLMPNSKTKSSNIKKDKKRTLTPAQKIWMWEHESHICIICKEEVKKQSDAHYDHIKPHVKGEKTTPAKMAITHANCNRMKGKKSLPQIQKELGTHKVKIKKYQDKVANTNNHMKYRTSTKITEFSKTNYFNPKDFEEFLWGLEKLEPFTGDSGRPPMSAQRFLNLFKLMRECNLKVSDAINLRKRDFDLKHKTIMIRHTNSDKVQKTTSLPKDDMWIQRFLLYYNGEDKIFPTTTQTVRQYAKDACRLAGLTV